MEAPAEPVRTSTVRKLPLPINRDADDSRLLLQVVGFYQETLKQSPEALEYFAQARARLSGDDRPLPVGLANRTLGYRLPASNRQAGAEMRGRLQKLGVLRETGHEHFNGSVVFPVFNRAGEVAGIYGRKINDDPPARWDADAPVPAQFASRRVE
jgi:hypothetical protein